MGGEWVDKAVGDIADVVGGSTPSTRDPANFDGDVPWLTPKDLSSPHSRYVKRGERNLSSKGFESCSAQLLPANSVLLSSRAPIGYLAIAANPIATNQGFRSLIVRPAYDHEFLYYWLSGNIEELERHSSGSTFKELSGTALKQIRLRLPVDRDEQRAIARILGTLDNKIELNRRMNATLEAMARALSQSWFVDFDPVRAKLDDRPPAALDPATAALFPEHLEESTLGHIPKGWTAGKIGDIGTNSRRGVQPGDIAPNTPYIALEHMPRRCIALGDWDDSADVASGKSAFKKGEILFGKLRPYFHKVGVAPFDGVCSTDILVLAPKSPEWFGFLLGHVSSDELIQFTDLASTGTKMPRTNWSDISSFKVVLPPKPIAAAFTRNIQPMLDRIHANLHQSRTLATLRDTLLPKLLSGELSVAEATGNRDFQVQPGMPKP